MQKQYKTLAIRGAITVQENTAESIQNASVELITTIINKNNISKEDIVSAIFTMTKDLDAEFPAKAARISLGWDDVSMICAQEISVPNSLPRCIRVLLTINSILEKSDIKHVYLGNAAKLRPDLSDN